MSSPFSKLPFTESGRMTGAVLGVSLVAVAIAIYLSPDSHHAKNADATTPATATATRTAPGSTTTATATATSTVTGAQPKPKTSIDVVKPPAATDVVVVKVPHRVTVTSTRPGSTTTVVTTPKQITITVPTKAELVAPAHKYYGLAEDGLPGSAPLYNSLDTEAGKAPSLVEWFEYWDDSFSPQKVTQAWQHDALPVMTWQSIPHDWSNTKTSISAYSLANIIAGNFDKYLKSFATSVVNTGLPLAIRLDQEMNGNWYPWSGGYAHRGIHNTPAQFRAAWQHIWNVFQAAGANQYVIWAWTPSRTNTLLVDSTTAYTAGDTGLAEDYPGDPYVDWMGMSAYQFRPAEPSTYQWIFGGTLTGNSQDIGLKQVSGKPILIAEMGSAQVVGGTTDNTAIKAAWTKETLATFAADPQIVGFTLFNNNVLAAHSIKLTDGTNLKVDTNWRFDSSAPVLAAFRAGIDNPVYGAGLMPPTGSVTIKVVPPRKQAVPTPSPTPTPGG
jgi:Glycosyl hydrolase family 26